MCEQIEGADIPSRAARSATPMPGVSRMAPRSETWPAETPSRCNSRRSWRLSWTSTGRSRLATATGSWVEAARAMFSGHYIA